jgi:hypothetical protein
MGTRTSFAAMAAGQTSPSPGLEPSRARLYGLLGLMLVAWSANFIFAKLATDAPASRSTLHAGVCCRSMSPAVLALRMA